MIGVSMATTQHAIVVPIAQYYAVVIKSIQEYSAQLRLYVLDLMGIFVSI